MPEKSAEPIETARQKDPAEEGDELTAPNRDAPADEFGDEGFFPNIDFNVDTSDIDSNLESTSASAPTAPTATTPTATPTAIPTPVITGEVRLTPSSEPTTQQQQARPPPGQQSPKQQQPPQTEATPRAPAAAKATIPKKPTAPPLRGQTQKASPRKKDAPAPGGPSASASSQRQLVLHSGPAADVSAMKLLVSKVQSGFISDKTLDGVKLNELQCWADAWNRADALPAELQNPAASHTHPASPSVLADKMYKVRMALRDAEETAKVNFLQV